MTHSFGFLLVSLLLSLSRVLVLTMTSTAHFPFVHSSIATILACERAEGRPLKTFLDPQTLEFRARCNEPSTDDLIDLAMECENIVFGEGSQTATENWDSSMRGLVAMGAQGTKDEATAATLLALNGLESAIRNSRGYVTGKAPLLKTMIAQMEDANFSGIFKLLLLPVPGLNLRNLIWHGFIGSLPRAWLALVLVMTRIVRDKSNAELSHSVLPTEVVPIRSHDAMQSVLAVGDGVVVQERLESSSIKEWLPPSHRGLWDLAVQWIGEGTKPTCTLAILTILLEHALRIDWCRVNDRPDDLLARPGAFFVTLDGHGQRHVHDLLLYPYLITETEDELVRNKLVDHLGGSTTALLTDLFASSCGGPNIRATVSHGLWDPFLDQELAGTEEKDSACTNDLRGMVRLVLVAIELCSGNSLSLKYRPVFSYTATTILNTKEALDSLVELSKIQSTSSFLDLYGIAEEEFGDISNDHLAALDVTVSYIETQVHELLRNEWESEPSEWLADDVFIEHELNQKLAACCATRTLLKDVSDATLLRVQSIKTAIEEWDETDSSKKRRRLLRVVHLADFALKVYTFATLVAVTSLNNGIDGPSGSITPATLLKAVERSRMVVSTVSTFLNSNSDRAIKAAREYAKGKAVKVIAKAHTKEET